MTVIARVCTTAAALLVVASTMSGCAGLMPAGGSAPAATADDPVTTRSVYGFVLITDAEMTSEKLAEARQRVWDSGDSSCVAPAGFEDIVAGGEVEVLTQDGVVAIGELQVGDFQSDVMSANGVLGCGFPFVVEGVPDGLDEYGVHVGSNSRPAYSFTASELRSGPRLFLP